MPRKEKVAKPRDETCTHPAVRLVRDTFRFCPNKYWRDAIILTTERSLDLWKDVIKEWRKPFYDENRKRNQKNGRNPLDWSHMLSEFERRYLGEPKWRLSVKKSQPRLLPLDSLKAAIERAENVARARK